MLSLCSQLLSQCGDVPVVDCLTDRRSLRDRRFTSERRMVAPKLDGTALGQVGARPFHAGHDDRHPIRRGRLLLRDGGVGEVLAAQAASALRQRWHP